MAKDSEMPRFARFSQSHCAPCDRGAEPLKGQALQELYRDLDHDWQLVDGTRLEKEFSFRDFRQALAFVNRVGELAEAEGHHPDLGLSWGKVTVRLWTHKIGGLHENDFILAARIDQL
jgi:4a-hydroxytetrahydrobiopterin dehydratase